jgi:cardiolipin synthase
MTDMIASEGQGAPVRLLEGAQAAWAAMLSSIDDAASSIHFEIYCFSDRGVGAQFISALNRAAARGVVVKVVVDGWGSLRSGMRIVASLRAGGCNVRVHNRISLLFIGRLNRNHRKLLVVDGERAVIAGMNVGDEFTDWDDLGVELHGAPCAALARRLKGERYVRQEGPVRVHLSRAGGGWRLRRMYVKSFAAARDRVRIAHAYFLPDGKLIRGLVALARRGISVMLLLPGKSDVPLAHLASTSLVGRCAAAGVRVIEWTHSILHAKVAVIDGRRLLLGSFNLDPFSLSDLETLVIIDNEQIAQLAERWIEQRLAKGQPLPGPSMWSKMRAGLGRVVVAIVRLIALALR